MTDPLPIDTSSINTPLPDAGHEAIRVAVLNSLNEFWTQHLALIDQLTALTARVTALEAPPAVPPPAPAPTPPV